MFAETAWGWGNSTVMRMSAMDRKDASMAPGLVVVGDEADWWNLRPSKLSIFLRGTV